MQKIVTNLWFDKNAEEAVNFYVSVFKNSRIIKKTHYTQSGSEVSGQKKGSVMTVEFVLDGQKFIAINGGPEFKFTPAISLMVPCSEQSEIDMLWEKLSDGGEKIECGWVTDRFGLSWQIVPTVLDKYQSDEDPVKVERVMRAMLKMKKLDIDGLKRAYEAHH
jgi:Uncharacterized protein conserved in bacteria